MESLTTSALLLLLLLLLLEATSLLKVTIEKLMRVGVVTSSAATLVFKDWFPPIVLGTEIST
jgi:hypothetical protein